MSDSAGFPPDVWARLERYRQWLSADEFQQLVTASQLPPLLAIRINILKITEAEARASWPDRYGWRLEPVPFCPSGWQIVTSETGPGHTIEYDNGQYYIQDAASMLPVELFSQSENPPLILDMAAAPGGKTTHLAARSGDRGVILANDSSANRLTALRANLQSWGTFSTMVTNFPGEQLGRWFPEVFDQVLLDAPCSGDTLRVTTGRKTRVVSDREREHLSLRQGALLASALAAVQPGGEIVYATCTLAPEENEAVLDDLLRAYPDAVQIDHVQHLSLGAPGLPGDGERSFHPDMREAVRLWPHRYRTSGFFAAWLRKTASIPIRSEAPPAVIWSQQRVPDRQISTWAASLIDRYGFDLRAVIEQHGLAVWQHGKLIFALPARLPAQFSDLPHLAAGLLIGQVLSEQFVPSHELVTRFETQFSGQRIVLPAAYQAAWLAGYDWRDVPAAAHESGAVLLIQDEQGRFLGRGKYSGNRIRNLRPKRLK